MSPTSEVRPSPLRILFILLGAAALLTSLLVTARPAAAGEVAPSGTIAIFKTMCESIGKQDVCNGRDTSLDGWHIDYTVHDDEDQLVQTITVTLGENAGGSGNTGGGSQGRNEGDPLPVGTYLVCEIPVAYNDADPRDEVPLDVLPRPEPGNGGSSGGAQEQVDGCILVTITTGTSELKFLDQQLEPEGTGSIEILKTDDGDPAAALEGAEFTVSGVEGTFTTGADGTFCVDGLELESTVTVTETVAPEGHDLADPSSQEVTVTVAGMCTDRTEEGPDATFVNPVTVIQPLPPTLVIDKVADAEVIEIADDTATPSIVTWTLTYTLTNGPVHNAVITDEIPAGFVFLDAANGGIETGGTVTWTFAELTASGSVSFRTTVDVDTISRTGATVNTATIVSDDTAPDDGEDSVTVTDEGTLGGNPTPTPPTPDLPDTALGDFGPMPATILSLLLLGSLAALAYVRVTRRR